MLPKGDSGRRGGRGEVTFWTVAGSGRRGGGEVTPCTAAGSGRDGEGRGGQRW